MGPSDTAHTEEKCKAKGPELCDKQQLWPAADKPVTLILSNVLLHGSQAMVTLTYLVAYVTSYRNCLISQDIIILAI